MRLLILFAALLWMTACTGGEKITKKVKDLRDAEMPEVDPTGHKEGDVQIFRSSFMGDSYAVIVYVEEEGKIKGYQSYVKATQLFDEVTYQWQDDVTLHFILLSNQNGQIERYSLTVENGKPDLVKVE